MEEANDQKTADDVEPTAGGLNVVVVSDMDILAGVFFLLRERASFFGERFAKWQVDNVPFVLNILDALAEELKGTLPNPRQEMDWFASRS